MISPSFPTKLFLKILYINNCALQAFLTDKESLQDILWYFIILIYFFTLEMPNSVYQHAVT